MKILSTGLVRKFAIYSLLASTLTGVVLSIIISDHIAADAINEKIQMVQFALNHLNNTEQIESVSEMTSEIDSESLLLKRIDSSMQIMGASDYFVWKPSDNFDQRLVLLQKASSVRTYQPSENEWLEDSDIYKIVMTLSNPKEKWLKINLPYFANNIETYTIITLFPYDEIEEHQNILNQNIVLTVAAGLFLLYFLLLKVISSASNTLVNQKDDLNRQNQELERAYQQLNISFHSTVKALTDSVDARDPYTSGHVRRVMSYSKHIGEAMGLDLKDITALILAAQMHDIGKIGISDAILLKPGQLTDLEYEIIKSHPEIGVGILKNVPDFKDILPAVLHHHERFDGRGYPFKLSGLDIPFNARIIAVADAYDAMTTSRPYRSSLSASEAQFELIKNKGTQFDPDITDIFIKILHDRNSNKC